jgi:hypothetical protein
MRVFDPIHKQLHVDRVCKFKSLTRCHSECMFVKVAVVCGSLCCRRSRWVDGVILLNACGRDVIVSVAGHIDKFERLLHIC